MQKFFFTVLILISSLAIHKSYTEEIIDLASYEKSYFSQNGEDGIIEFFFSLVEPKSHFCVEFGAGDGYWISNTLNLRSNKGWKTLLLDSNHENKSINLNKEFITAENINHLFEKYQVPNNLDLLSIDLDHNDFYVWFALDEMYKPSLIVLEYNCSYGPNEDKIVVYNPSAIWDGTNYHGASLKALYLLARTKNYSLIYVEKSGTNCFFVRDDILEELKEKGVIFAHVNDLEKLCRETVLHHPEDPLNRPLISAEELLNRKKQI